MEIGGLPVGFGFALMMDPDALRNFTILPKDKRNDVLSQARQSSSKKETHDLIDALASGRFF